MSELKAQILILVVSLAIGVPSTILFVKLILEKLNK